MKKFFLYILVSFLCILNFNSAYSQENFSCELDFGTAPELLEYYKKIESELSQIAQNKEQDSWVCEYWNYQKATSVFNLAWANMRTMDTLYSDFAFNIYTVGKIGSPGAVIRDEKIFSKLEKKVESITRNLASKCALNEQNEEKLAEILREIATIHGFYQNASYGVIRNVDLTGDIRAENKELTKAILTKYSQYNTESCKAQTNAPESFSQSLWSILNLGGKMEKSLETWRKATALIRSAHDGGASEAMIARQRSILAAELSRQWLSPNMQRVMINNFNCYKSRSSDTNNILDVVQNRMWCASIPVTWVEESMMDFHKFTWKSSNTDELVKRQETLWYMQSRSIDIVNMHSKLQAMTSVSADTNDMTKANLIKLHSNLVKTNELLEERIPRAQANCMKWQPDLVGGCR